MKTTKNKSQNNWTTWWIRAQRGLGLFQKSCLKHQRIQLKEIPASSKMSLKFSAYYDLEDVVIENILIHDTKNTVEICPLCKIESQKEMTFENIDLVGLDRTKLVIEYTIQNQCVSGFEFMDYDEFVDAPAQIYGLSKIDLYTDQLDGCVCVFGDSIVEQGHYTRILKKELNQQNISLLNLGLSGNRLLKQIETIDLTKTENEDVLKNIPSSQKVIHSITRSNQAFGLSGLSRFQNELLSCRNIKKIIFAIGVNDLYQPGTFCASIEELPEVDTMMQAYESLEKTCAVPCAFCEITSFLGDPDCTKEKEDRRRQVNTQLSKSHTFIALDHVLKDRDQVFNEDMLHPNKEGGKRIAKEIESWLLS